MDNREIARFLVDDYQRIVGACNDKVKEVGRSIVTSVVVIGTALVAEINCLESLVYNGDVWTWCGIVVFGFMIILSVVVLRKDIKHWGYLYYIQEVLRLAYLEYQVTGSYQQFVGSVGSAASRLRCQLKVTTIPMSKPIRGVASARGRLHVPTTPSSMRGLRRKVKLSPPGNTSPNFSAGATQDISPVSSRGSRVEIPVQPGKTEGRDK